jgi:hypothetical protein
MPELIGESDVGHGVRGISHSDKGFGVFGQGNTNTGVVGESAIGHGIVGLGHSDKGIGVLGQADVNTGVLGESKAGHGVVGLSHSAASFGVFGKGELNSGVVGESDAAIGVFGKTATGEAAIRGDHTGGGDAGVFNGNVRVSGDLTVGGDVRLTGGDVAEQFEAAGAVAEPGCVVVLAGEDSVRVSDKPYDRTVAGVVSGAGSYKPALVLDRRGRSAGLPVALTGKVWCKVDADCGPVELGDMLTTSSTPGHAMRASDPDRAYGAVIGKALGSLQAGRGMLPVLVFLH